MVNGVHVAMNATGEILKTGSQVLTAAPRAASRQANLLGGLVKVANESAPSISSVSAYGLKIGQRLLHLKGGCGKTQNLDGPI